MAIVASVLTLKCGPFTTRHLCGYNVLDRVLSVDTRRVYYGGMS